MVDITIVNGVYKPTYNWGAPSCIGVPFQSSSSFRHSAIFCSASTGSKGSESSVPWWRAAFLMKKCLEEQNKNHPWSKFETQKIDWGKLVAETFRNARKVVDREAPNQKLWALKRFFQSARKPYGLSSAHQFSSLHLLLALLSWVVNIGDRKPLTCMGRDMRYEKQWAFINHATIV